MNTKLRCLLLDDELPGLTYLKMLCEQLPEIEVVKAFNNPTLLLKESAELVFDLCILDIEMPEMNGLELAKRLAGKPVIFTTAYTEYAAEAFDLFAIDFVRKPVQKERLQLAIQKAIKMIHTDHSSLKFIQLNTNLGRSIIYLNQIVYLKTSDIDSRDKQLWLMDGRMLLLKNISFEKILEILPAAEFCQVNKKELIALKHVKHFSNDEIVLFVSNVIFPHKTFSLGVTFRTDFLKKITL